MEGWVQIRWLGVDRRKQTTESRMGLTKEAAQKSIGWRRPNQRRNATRISSLTPCKKRRGNCEAISSLDFLEWALFVRIFLGEVATDDSRMFGFDRTSGSLPA